MDPSILLDEALRSVAVTSGTAADAVLDFRESLRSRTDAGQCLHCYFKIFGSRRSHQTRAMMVLREWIERQLVIVVRDEEQRELERLKVRLEEEDLDSYCHRVSKLLRHDRAYLIPRLEVEFVYAEQVAA